MFPLGGVVHEGIALFRELNLRPPRHTPRGNGPAELEQCFRTAFPVHRKEEPALNGYEIFFGVFLRPLYCDKRSCPLNPVDASGLESATPKRIPVLRPGAAKKKSYSAKEAASELRQKCAQNAPLIPRAPGSALRESDFSSLICYYRDNK